MVESAFTLHCSCAVTVWREIIAETPIHVS